MPIKFRKPKETPEKEEPDYTEYGGSALLGSGLERFFDNFSGLAESAARGIEYGQNLPKKILPSSMADFLFGEQQITPPGDTVLGLPTGREILAGAGALPGLLSGDYSQQFDAAMAERDAIAEQNPIATLAGQLGGDAATLMLGRAPRSGPGGMFDEFIRQNIDKLSSSALKVAGNATPAARTVGQSLSKEFGNRISSETFRNLAKGAGRSLETGLEGALLAVAQDGDPLETAGFAAGTQAASSLALYGVSETFQLGSKAAKAVGLGPVGKFVAGGIVSAGLAAGLMKLLQADPEAAEETAYDKLALGVVLGIAAIGGKRSKADGVLKEWPTIADGILTIPRAAMINAAQKWAEKPEDAQLVSALAENPNQFTPEQIQGFRKGLESDNPDDAVNSLRPKVTFRKVDD